MRKTRRRFLQGAAGFVGGCTLGSAAAAAASATVSFSYQQSSALLITLKARGMLDGALAAKSCVADWHQFSRIVDAMSSNAVDFHGDVADAVPGSRRRPAHR